MAIPMTYASVDTTVISIGLTVSLRDFIIGLRRKKEKKHAQ